ncbi:NADH:flavin oxidoreductase [Hymenobacter ginsengisoli]|uniref:NADH:flavin oxidoreductase n=1 Tax=Hymenobacter ginsengisoli TaxID=1051626 RepID=A0ABP8PUH8_9BACT|nr:MULTISPECIES: NADH:flavin oxidoreductase [unclassified Hymenobacter]MBO2033727.1 NADH:flavin oxidoreductase [Hymenobacter sp. BT559]
MPSVSSATPFPALFTPFQLGRLSLTNRLALAPMTRASASPDGTVTPAMVAYYTKFARGGFSLLLTEGTYPDEAFSQGYLNQPGLANAAQTASWRPLTQAVHQAGAKIICQLMHAGALVQGNRFETTTLAPSAVTPKGEQMSFYGGQGAFPTPQAMNQAAIARVTESFVEAARRAVAAGFDGVEIHGANGYVLDQFLTDYTNQRTDQYGGSPENRVRLLAEVVQATRAALPPDVVVGIRISQGKVNDYTHKWAGGEPEAAVIFGALRAAGADFIHVTEFDALQPAFGDSGPSLAALARRYGQVPVLVNGNLNEPAQAQQSIVRGEADIITLGKGALANQNWPERVAAGQELVAFQPENFLFPRATLKPHEL